MEVLARPDPGEAVARLAGVRHLYGATQALGGDAGGVDLDIPAGVMAGLIGPDGVGKSTLLALVAGVRRLQTGRVQVLGGDMADRRHRAASAARIAYMPQGLGRNLYPTLSVRENLEFFSRLFGQAPQERAHRIDRLLAATGLAPFPDRPAGKLSGGMKQKLGLCAALLHDPDLLILDEPTTGVDPLSRRQFWELIDTIRAERPGMSVLTATAYMEEADRFDWIAALDDGQVIATGTPDDLRARTGEATLEAAFVALLPPTRRARGGKVELRPRDHAGARIAIEAEGLTRRFGDFTAVDNVSFRIPEGEIFGFLGSNGCGKTTTMKMLTGLLDPSAGTTRLFGAPLGAADVEARLRIGYMSQNFSLYSELTVRQNLVLHARLYGVAPERRAARIAEVLEEFALAEVAGAMPDSLPLGLRQRLQLAVAMIHEPKVLILDEPTSGVDPIARDEFWVRLMSLSRDRGVTIFISTHFMNEAERCDRISLMHAGRVLEVGPPAEIVARRGAESLEAAFIDVLEAEGAGDAPHPQTPPQTPSETAPETAATAALIPQGPETRRRAGLPAGLRRLMAYSWRETLELTRDPIRLFFALVGPVVLLLAMGFGISFDVDRLSLAVNDLDRSAESRRLVDAFTAIRQFEQKPDLTGPADIDARMGLGGLTLALEIPDGFGRDLHRGDVPEISLWVDGAMPFRAETARGYALGVLEDFADKAATEEGLGTADPVTIETRYLFNQAFKSAHAMVPSVLMLILMLIPAIMSAVSVVREKETGTIANFRSAPVRRIEFLIGKQIPYLVLAWVAFWMLVGIGLWIFGVPLTGNLAALGLAALLYVTATTGFGQFVSSFTSSQVAAVFATAVVSVIPTVNFSGLIVPVSSLAPSGRALGQAFPGAWFQPVSVGTFVKGFGWSEAATGILALAGFAGAYLILSILALRKQEA
ncbi:ribosome-associated ATPase/putative transporter RbbA [Phaeovulum vinaykumarii]|uniref:Ribosome-dependent ATPase n=1 Tax=Phaeovulum vinaykumarii TaxID=407234 RepID=A0A1N7JVY9_9RHOB|nr:ribosome-associated ATPase/putative transporter RbbA [Phaeovulum vinaykumarii]SIS53522.1 ribosome-dependent ATPase [Phaeovulum vinaykumarii]SOB91615.1 ribosome-dependent ATPase [Phaeovulum vinaykumarii]